MQFPQQVSHCDAAMAGSRFMLLTVCLGLAAPAAEAAGPRPFFQMPFACGQTWEASTYDGHWPDQDSIDLGEWDPQDANMSQGEPVLASADGTVLDVFTDGGGDNRVYLDHGDGWVTHYIHLEQVPPLTKGQHVAQGEQIGRVGNSGTEAYHLHYTPAGRRQRRADRVQRHADRHARRQPGVVEHLGQRREAHEPRTAR